MSKAIYDESTQCDICKRLPVIWHLVNETDHWDFYRARCSGPCERSVKINQGWTYLATKKASHGQALHL